MFWKKFVRTRITEVGKFDDFGNSVPIDPIEQPVFWRMDNAVRQRKLSLIRRERNWRRRVTMKERAGRRKSGRQYREKLQRQGRAYRVRQQTAGMKAERQRKIKELKARIQKHQEQFQDRDHKRKNAVILTKNR